MSESYLEIQLDQQPIELCKLLKIADLVAGGGEAKVVISEGYVLLNGEVECQKRKKVYHNDIVEFNGETIQVIINEDLSENLADISSESSTDNSTEKATPQMIHGQEHKSFTSLTSKKTAPTTEGAVRNSKRKPIYF